MTSQACAPARSIHPFVTSCTTVQQSAEGPVCTRFRRHLYWRTGDYELTISGATFRRCFVIDAWECGLQRRQHRRPRSCQLRHLRGRHGQPRHLCWKFRRRRHLYRRFHRLQHPYWKFRQPRHRYGRLRQPRHPYWWFRRLWRPQCRPWCLRHGYVERSQRLSQRMRAAGRTSR